MATILLPVTPRMGFLVQTTLSGRCYSSITHSITQTIILIPFWRRLATLLVGILLFLRQAKLIPMFGIVFSFEP